MDKSLFSSKKNNKIKTKENKVESNLEEKIREVKTSKTKSRIPILLLRLGQKQKTKNKKNKK